MSQHVAELFNCVRKQTCKEEALCYSILGVRRRRGFSQAATRHRVKTKLREKFYFCIFFELRQPQLAKNARCDRKLRQKLRQCLNLRFAQIAAAATRKKKQKLEQLAAATTREKSEKLQKKIRVAAAATR